jgi:hypothetical protein
VGGEGIVWCGARSNGRLRRHCRSEQDQGQRLAILWTAANLRVSTSHRVQILVISGVSGCASSLLCSTFLGDSFLTYGSLARHCLDRDNSRNLKNLALHFLDLSNYVSLPHRYIAYPRRDPASAPKTAAPFLCIL